MILTPAARDVVRVWELGQDRPAWFRGLLMLAPALPDRTFDDLAAMTIGQRNIHLFRLRRALFGETLSAVARCPRCAAPSEFTATVGELCPHPDPAPGAAGQTTFSIDHDGRAARFHCPTSHDVAAIEDAPGGAADAITLSPALVARCIEAIDGVPEHPTQALIEAVTEACYDHDPQLELQLGLACAECGHAWSAPFDCVGFLWTEVAHLARRLLGDVDVLARAYGWREADILALSEARRAYYLERAAP